MGKSNRRAKRALIRLYGPECFIEKLHLRPDKPRKYTGKSQYRRMKKLTYHHILEKSRGGESTVENGAILSVENHIWFNQQSKEKQREMNRQFQEYKRDFMVGVASIFVEDREIQTRKLELTSEPFELPPEIEAGEIVLEPMTPEELLRYEEHKRKRRDRISQKFKNQTEKGER